MKLLFQMKKTPDGQGVYWVEDDHGQIIKDEYVVIPVEVWNNLVSERDELKKQLRMRQPKTTNGDLKTMGIVGDPE